MISWQLLVLAPSLIFRFVKLLLKTKDLWSNCRQSFLVRNKKVTCRRMSDSRHHTYRERRHFLFGDGSLVEGHPVPQRSGLGKTCVWGFKESVSTSAVSRSIVCCLFPSDADVKARSTSHLMFVQSWSEPASESPELEFRDRTERPRYWTHQHSRQCVHMS